MNKLKILVEIILINDIKSKLSSEKTTQLIDKLSKTSNVDTNKVKNQLNVLNTRLNQVGNKYDLDKVKLDIKNVTSQEDINKYLNQGYSLISYDSKNKTDKSSVSQKIILPIDIKLDNLFKSGSYELSPEGIDTLNKFIEGFNSVSLGGEVTEMYIEVESSTDTEPIKMTNDSLVKRRADVVTEKLKEGGINVNLKTLKPNSGPDVYKTGMSSSERLKSREMTSPYRYTTIKGRVKIELDPKVMVKYDENELSGVLVKIITSGGDYKTSKIKTKTGKGEYDTKRSPTQCWGKDC